MKKLIVLIIILNLAYPSHAQNVTIPDANFKAALIEEGVDSNADGEISYTEAEAVTSLDVTEKNISDLTGIEAFSNLESLECYSNQLLSLDVSNNTALEYLGCYDNQLTSLNVSNNTVLEVLYCWRNQLTEMDVSNNTALLDLHCGGTHHGGGGNQLTSLDVTNNIALKYLSCANNQLTSLDVSDNTALEQLSCDNNQLTSLDVSNNIALIGLDCYKNQLTTLDVTNNIALKYLSCANNQLTSLNVSNNILLWALYCGSNLFTTLDISNNLALGTYSCWGPCIDIGDMPSLYEVCVWDDFSTASIDVNTEGSPNVNFTTECSVTALSENQNKYSVTIYPNPATDQVSIDFGQTVAATSVMLFDLTGKLVYSETIDNTDSQTHTINLSSLRKGLYLIRISNDRFSVTEKVIKTE